MHYERNATYLYSGRFQSGRNFYWPISVGGSIALSQKQLHYKRAGHGPARNNDNRLTANQYRNECYKKSLYLLNQAQIVCPRLIFSRQISVFVSLLIKALFVNSTHSTALIAKISF